MVRRPVKWGQEHGGLTVVTEGLKASDRVVVGYAEEPRPGSVVQPEVVEMPGSRSKAR